MTPLERFLAVMNYAPADRVPLWSWWGWPETVERWKTEGYDPQTDHPDAAADPRTWIGHWFFPHPPFERKVVQEDAEHVVYINHEGILMKERKDQPWSSMPQFLKFPVTNRQEFRTFWRERMQPDLAARVGADWREQLRRLRAQPQPLIILADRWGGFFGPPRNLFGVEPLCLLFYDDPPFLEEVLEHFAEFMLAIMRQVLDVVTPDVFGFWEDMGYNHAPLVSPEMVRRFMLPRYRRVAEYVRGRGVPFVALDSDGQIDSLIPAWMEAGINTLYPFEVQCGMDVNAVRRTYGRELRLWGGVDKRALAQGPAAIDAEIARVRPLLRAGGYIPHTDHSAPPDISYQNYCHYMRRMAEACAAP